MIPSPSFFKSKNFYIKLTIFLLFGLEIYNLFNYFEFNIISVFHPVYISLIFYLIYLFIVEKYFNKTLLIILVGVFIFSIIFSSKLFNFVEIINIYFDTDNFDYQHPLWTYIVNEKPQSNWFEHFGFGHRFVGQVPLNYLLFKLVGIQDVINISSFNFYIILHYLLAATALRKLSNNLNLNKTESFLFIITILTSNLLVLWQSFIHFPAFVLGLSIALLSLYSKNNEQLLYLGFANYVLASGSHLQYLLMVNLFLALYFLLSFLLSKNFKKFSRDITNIVISNLLNIVPIFYFFETLFISDRVSASGFIELPVIDLETIKSIFFQYSDFTIKSLNYDLHTTSFVVFVIFIFVFKTDELIVKMSLTVLSIFILFSSIGYSLFSNLFIFKYVSNWQRFSHILVFLIITLTFSILNKLEVFSLPFFKYLIIITILISSFNRLNYFMNNQLNIQSSHAEISELVKDIGNSYRVATVCFDTQIDTNKSYFKYDYRPNRGYLFNKDIRWAGVYDSWVTKGYKFYFEQLSQIKSQIPYGGGWYFARKGSQFDIKMAEAANIKYLLMPKSQDCLETDGLNVFKKSKNFEIFQLQDPVERIHFPNQVIELAKVSSFESRYLLNEKIYTINLNSPNKKVNEEFSKTFLDDGVNIVSINGKRFALFIKNESVRTAGSSDEFNELILKNYVPLSSKSPYFSYFLFENELENDYEFSTKDYSDDLVSFNPSKVEIISTNFKNGEFYIQLTNSEDNFLIYTESWDPGWAAYIDNVDVEIYIVNDVFMGIKIPPGAYTIKFIYENISFKRLLNIG